MKEIGVFFINIIDNITSFYNRLDANERILFYLIIVLLLVIFFLIILLEIKTKSLKQKRKEKNNLIETKQPLLLEDKKEEHPLVEVKEPQETLDDSNKIDLEKIKKQLEEDAKTKNINLTSFEKEQEETAIISYDELKRKVEKEKPVSLNDMVMEIQKRNEVNEEEKQVEKKYKPSPYISPIYGIVDEPAEFKREIKEVKEEKPQSLEETLNLEPISQEIKKNDEFLEALKDFRRSLD
jgi:hypothetical protein